MHCAVPGGCPADSNWPATEEDGTARRNCTCEAKPSLVEGLAATRRCLANGQWEAPNEAACERSPSLEMLCEVRYEVANHEGFGGELSSPACARSASLPCIGFNGNQ